MKKMIALRLEETPPNPSGIKKRKFFADEELLREQKEHNRIPFNVKTPYYGISLSAEQLNENLKLAIEQGKRFSENRQGLSMTDMVCKILNKNVEKLPVNLPGFETGIVSKQGMRRTQEDMFRVEQLSLPDGLTASFFAVYDGHGGKDVAEEICKGFHKSLYVFLNRAITGCLEDAQTPPSSEKEEFFVPAEVVTGALSKTFAGMDQVIRAMQEEAWLIPTITGCTAATVLVLNGIAYVANLGDSSVVLVRNKEVFRLAYQHVLAQNTDEHLRIVNLGGKVMPGKRGPELRIEGELNVPRAFGDWKYKGSKGEKLVSSEPFFSAFKLEEDDIVVICCDGIAGPLTDNHIEMIVAEETISLPSSQEGVLKHADSLVKAAESGCGGIPSTDNMTTIVARVRRKE